MKPCWLSQRSGTGTMCVVLTKGALRDNECVINIHLGSRNRTVKGANLCQSIGKWIIFCNSTNRIGQQV